jgi:[FeFe] hydrogenase (group B1/B3)
LSAADSFCDKNLLPTHPFAPQGFPPQSTADKLSTCHIFRGFKNEKPMGPYDAGELEERPEIGVLAEIAQAFLGGDFFGAIENYWGRSISAGQDAAMERRERILAGLGFAVEDDDGQRPLGEYAAEALTSVQPAEYPITVLGSVCRRCPAAHVHVTDLCQNCTAHRCSRACPFRAITFGAAGARIVRECCKKCGRCMDACPYGAIAKTVVPCESVCPVDALAKDARGKPSIDFNRCISCGHCFTACPFHAISFRSQLVAVLQKMKIGKEMVALFAPALAGQFSFNAEKLHRALRSVGFSHVYEVALGAEITARTEAEDLRENLAGGQSFLTTSCCAAYRELVAKHLPEMGPHVSHAGTPLYYTSILVKKQHPDAVQVFLCPCFAKFREVLANPLVSHALSFFDVAALFAAHAINETSLEELPFSTNSAREAREFPLAGGVARSVQALWKENGETVRPAIIDGLDRGTVEELRRYAKDGSCDRGNLLEVMACRGGCIGGPAGICPRRRAKKNIETHAASGGPLTADNAADHTSTAE